LDSRNSISKILNRLENEMPLVEEGDIIETIKTIYPSSKIPKEERNIILEGIEMTMPMASSRESKLLLEREKSRLLEVYKDIDRGDILIVKEIHPNKIIVENCSVKDEYKKDFEIEKLDIIKGNFNVVKRRSIDLIKTLNKLIGDS
jgi:hypothetical protein